MYKDPKSLLECIDNIRVLAGAIRSIEPGEENEIDKAEKLKIDWAFALSREIEKEAGRALVMLLAETGGHQASSIFSATPTDAESSHSQAGPEVNGSKSKSLKLQ